MNREAMDTFAHTAAVMRGLRGDGLLLGAYNRDDKPNIMTVGWGTLGVVWGLPMWVVLVRPSRYTFECIEHAQAFTVNVPTPEMAHACGVCGTLSGRDINKFAECELNATRAATVGAPLVDQCPVTYECKVVHHNDVLPDTLAQGIIDGAYPVGDFHRVYYGQVTAADADADAAKLLGG